MDCLVMDWLRPMVQRALAWVDRRYHRAHALQAVGPVLFVGQGTYQGPPMQFADGTQLQAGDAIGALHFNNARLSELEASSSTAAALGFARLMFKSLHRLAEKSRHDPAFSGFTVYHGVTGLPPHGHKQGFVTAPYPDGVKRRLMVAYLRLLLWAFAAAPQSRAVRPDPHYYWLTRTELLRKFAAPYAPEKRKPARKLIDAETRHG